MSEGMLFAKLRSPDGACSPSEQSVMFIAHAESL